MRVLVTGGTGFIGSHLIEALTSGGHEVVTLSRRLEIPVGAARHIVWDVADAVPDINVDVDAVVHLAGAADASSSLADPVTYGRINGLGTLHLLEAARRLDARFILASTQRVYQPRCSPIAEDVPLQPVDPYGYSKLVAEEWVRMYHEMFALRTVTLRFFSVYGPGQVITSGSSGVVAIFVIRALDGAALQVASASLRDFTYVSDVAQGILLALESTPAIGRTYNIATGVGMSIATLAETIRNVTASSSTIEVREVKESEPHAGYVADITRARRELGYEPRVELQQGLERYVEHLRRTIKNPA